MSQHLPTVIWVYLTAVNLAAFAVMGVDKSRAKREAWRVRESTLFLLALVGGSVGSILGMRVFRHKTRHWYFVWGMPAVLVLQLALAAGAYYFFCIK